MRKQYHFWPGERRLDAWDVDRLIPMTANLPTEEVDIGAISEVDTTYWFVETQEPTVRAIVEHAQLIQQADLRFPIILGPDNRVMDGMHRIAKAMLNNISNIKAVRLHELPEPDYRNCIPTELPY